MPGPFVHNIDPIIGQVGGFYLWWYGLSYTLGFLGVFFRLRRVRGSLKMDPGQVYGLTILIAAGVLLGGRLIEVFFYEWTYYGAHPRHIPAIWLGGMSTHGILLGGVLAVLWFSRRCGISFFALADELAICAAYIMGVGRIGNFIDGQIMGSVTEVWWAVKFPDAEGFRHPVVLYDGLKNLLLIPFLLLLKRRHPPRGALLGHFVLWYGFLRIFVDFFREYRTDFLGFPPGQEFNVFMTLAGLGIIVWAYLRRKRSDRRIGQTGDSPPVPAIKPPRLWPKRAVFLALLLIPLVMPSDWTQDVPRRYGNRHEGLKHSWIYPEIPTETNSHEGRDDEP